MSCTNETELEPTAPKAGRFLRSFTRGLALGALAVGLVCGPAWAQTEPRYRLHTPKAQPQETKTSRAQSESHDQTGSTTPVRRTETRTETKQGEVVIERLETPSINGRYELRSETEVETIKVDANTTRVIRRLFNRNPDGRRTVIEVSEEEHQRLSENSERVVRTTSKPNLSGKLQLTRQEIQETSQVAPGTRQTQTTVLEPDINGGLATTRQLTETEQQTGEGVVLVEQTQRLPDGNQRWDTYETRERVIRTEGEDVRSEEQVFRRDADRKLSLAERTLTHEWKDAAGAEHQTVETRSRNIGGTTRTPDGRLMVVERIRTVRRTQADGSQQTTQEVERSSAVAPGESPRVVERTMQFSRPVGPGGTQIKKTVQTPDPNGRYRTVIVLEGGESKP
jgi:hypothetical protein